MTLVLPSRSSRSRPRWTVMEEPQRVEPSSEGFQEEGASLSLALKMKIRGGGEGKRGPHGRGGKACSGARAVE